MEDGIKRIQKTVTGLLGFARNPNVDRSPIPIGTLIEKVLSLLEYEIRKAGIMVVKEIDPDIPPVSLDRDQMGQVMVNLFLNAIQAMEKGGTLTVRIHQVPGKVVIKVSDTGRGIPEEIHKKVFDPFFTTKGETQGTGLGLWLSQGIVERHGGTIQLTSQEGKGTTLEIQLPL